MIVVSEPVGFVWDKGNQDKNWLKHKVSCEECEQAFFDESRKIFSDVTHSRSEERFILLGMTDKKRLLYIVFTLRADRVRVISARGMNKKERKLYEKEA